MLASMNGVKFIIGFVNDQAVLQFLQEKELIETLVALECETGLKYVDLWWHRIAQSQEFEDAGLVT